MSKCEYCARVVMCPRPETRRVRLNWIPMDAALLVEFLAGRGFPEGTAAPAKVYAEFVLELLSDPVIVSRRLYAVVFRLAEDLDVFSEFAQAFRESIKDTPSCMGPILSNFFSSAFQLYEWYFYAEHVERFSKMAESAGFADLSPGIKKLDELVCAKVPCAYLNHDRTVLALREANAQTSKDVDAVLEKLQASEGPLVSSEEFFDMPPVGGIN